MAYKRKSPIPVVEGGTGAITLTGVLTGNGTSAVTGGTVTQYGVLVGGASNAVTSTAQPTSAYLLTSNGAGVAPTFQEVPPMGKFIQQVFSSTSTFSTHTATTPYDDTIPQNTEGDEILTVSITPTSATNRLFITSSIWGQCNTSTVKVISAFFQDSTAGALAANAIFPEVSSIFQVILNHDMVSGTTSSTTFKVRMGVSAAGTYYINGSSAAAKYNGVGSCVLTIYEYEP